MQLSKHHQVMINASAALIHQLLEHNNSDINDDKGTDSIVMFLKVFEIDLKDFLKEYGYKISIKINKIIEK